MSASAAAAASASSPAKPLTAESTIRRVVVYSDRAQVFRLGSVHAAAGDHTILFEGMWNSVNRDTLQVATTPIAGAAVILRSVQFTTIHDVVDVRPLRRDVDEKLAALEIPLEDAQDEIDLASRAIANYDALKAKLTKSLSDGSHPKGSPFVYDVALWGKFSSFIEEGRGAELRKKRAAERKLTELRKKKEDLGAEAAGRAGGSGWCWCPGTRSDRACWCRCRGRPGAPRPPRCPRWACGPRSRRARSCGTREAAAEAARPERPTPRRRSHASGGRANRREDHRTSCTSDASRATGLARPTARQPRGLRRSELPR
jgi:hypothetical protein